MVFSDTELTACIIFMTKYMWKCNKQVHLFCVSD